LAFGSTGKLVLSNNNVTIFAGSTSTNASVTGTNPLVQFAYSGGMSVTNYYTYVVGSNCALQVASIQEPLDFSFLNPVEDYIKIHAEDIIDKVEVYNMTGVLVLETKTDTNNIDIKNLSQGIYLLAVHSGDKRSVKKMIVK
jgi:hypothetical protein